METVKNHCPCKATECDRHGKCEACRENQATKKGMFPYCEKMEHKKIF